jgi:phosphoribosyl 1,2-cyclic phosphate phosphodiesterase
MQLLDTGIRRVDAVFLTHLHADHVHGIDDLRVFTVRERGPLPLHVAQEYAAELAARFPYIFDEGVQPNPGTTSPDVELSTFAAGEETLVAGFKLIPLSFPHGHVHTYGFRVGRLGVVVDGKTIPADARRFLEGVDVLVINALWWGNPHPTHFNVEEAVEAARSLGARRTYLTHLTHRLEHEDLRAALPEGVEPAYDGLTVEID